MTKITANCLQDTGVVKLGNLINLNKDETQSQDYPQTSHGTLINTWLKSTIYPKRLKSNGKGKTRYKRKFLAMRKDSIDSSAFEKALLIYAERGLQVQDYTHKPTDYARGTVLEPETTSKLRVNFGEYESLGNRCKEICSEIETLQNKMAITRSRGNFQALQTQMKLVSNLMKEKSAIDAKMAVIDLARKKNDEHDLAVGDEPTYAEKIESVSSRIAELEARIASLPE